MSLYDSRDEPAYAQWRAPPAYSENPHIGKWWTRRHDGILEDAIQKDQWAWPWGIAEKIVEVTPSDTLETWKTQDPICRQYAWYNVLMYFAISRASRLGLTRRIRKPQWKTCPLCGERFVEDSLPVPLIERLGIDRLAFCAPCLRDTVLQGSGSDSLSRDDVLAYLKDLTDVMQVIPCQGFGEGKDDLALLTDEERLSLLRLLKRKPTTRRVRRLFRSWLHALVKAGVLAGGVRKMTRGVQCIARDGHVCLSLGEKTIDDFLTARQIHHRKEPRYPQSNLRADFEVKGIFIEYFGLTGDEDYDKKARTKAELCKAHGIVLVAIYPEDLVSRKRLEGKLLGRLSLAEANQTAQQCTPADCVQPPASRSSVHNG